MNKSKKPEDKIKIGDDILWLNPLNNNEVETGTVVHLDDERVSIIWLEGYKSRNDDVLRKDVLSITNKKIKETAGEVEIYPFTGKGIITDAGYSYIKSLEDLKETKKNKKTI